MAMNVSDKDDQDRFHSRKHPRIPYYDYSKPNYYFVTICTHEKTCMFGAPEQLNQWGSIAAHAFLTIPSHFPSVKVDKYVVMPNHVHAIIVLQGNDVKLPVVIGQYKSFVSREIHKFQPNIPVWQTSFHDHVIRNQRSYARIWNYIDANPTNWNKDCFYEG